MFVAGVLEAAGGGLEEVRIEELRDDTFHAVTRIRAGETVREVDARPSDAMSLAAVAGSPIYVADEVMEKAGQDVPQELAAEQPKRKGIEAIAQKMAKEPGHPHTGGLMAYVFGSEE